MVTAGSHSSAACAADMMRAGRDVHQRRGEVGRVRDVEQEIECSPDVTSLVNANVAEVTAHDAYYVREIIFLSSQTKLRKDRSRMVPNDNDAEGLQQKINRLGRIAAVSCTEHIVA